MSPSHYLNQKIAHILSEITPLMPCDILLAWIDYINAATIIVETYYDCL